MLTTFDDDEYIIRSLQAGASGYLLKDIAAEDLAQAVRLVNAGIYQLAPAVAGKLVGQLGNKQQRRDQITTAPGVVDELTERELLVPFFVVTLLSA